MSENRVLCPGCNKRLKMLEPVAVGDKLRCPRCNHSWIVCINDLLPGPDGPIPSSSDFALTAPSAAPAVSVAPAPAPPTTLLEPQGGRKVFLFLAGISCLVLGAGIVLVIALSGKERNKQEDNRVVVRPDDPVSSPPSKPTPSAPLDDGRALHEDPKPLAPPSPIEGPALPPDPKPMDGPAKPVDEPKLPIRLADNDRNDGKQMHPEDEKKPEPAVAVFNPLPKEKQARVNAAIQRGVKFLKSKQLATGSWQDRGHVVGCAALPR